MPCVSKARVKVASLIKPTVGRGLKIINAILSSTFSLFFSSSSSLSLLPFHLLESSNSPCGATRSCLRAVERTKARHRDNAIRKKTDNRSPIRTKSSGNCATTIYRLSGPCSTTELMDTMRINKRGAAAAAAAAAAIRNSLETNPPERSSAPERSLAPAK